MKRRRRAPTFAEAHEAVMRRINRMTREDWIRSIEELSRAPDGVEDPWPPYNGELSVDGWSSTPIKESKRPEKDA